MFKSNSVILKKKIIIIKLLNIVINLIDNNIIE